MGYAYAQGMIDELKEHLAEGTIFGRFYILMPENPCSATTFDKSLFEEVWQYGSHETEDPLWEQDGVAPQCAVGTGNNILEFDAPSGARYGRIRIPGSQGSKRNFVDAHTDYSWIINTITNPQAPGYVKKR
jgi:hypothetical protein